MSKGQMQRLTAESGTSAATFSSDFRYFLNVHSALAKVPVTTLREGNSGKSAHYPH